MAPGAPGPARASEYEHSDHELDELRRRFIQKLLPTYAEAALDPLLAPSQINALVARFLRAERNQRSSAPVETAEARLRDFLQFRHAYRCVDFHRRGMARLLFHHQTNPGAAMYFGDMGLRDRQGSPVLVGRIALMSDERAPGFKPADRMIPSTHIRAAIFVIERAVLEAARGGASYILDLSAYPAGEMKAHEHARYWDADGCVDCSDAIKRRVAPSPSVGPHLPQHESCPDGMPVLKEALRIATTFYPESLRRVWFYKPNLLFWAAFKIFSMWVPQDTRDKFVMVREGEEAQTFLKELDAATLPAELGGQGKSLDGDRFLARAVAHYDATATLDPLFTFHDAHACG